MASKSYKFGKKNFTTSTKKFVPGWKKNVKRYNGTVEAEAIEVTWGDIDISNRRNQCRQTDTVEGHVSELAISIFNNGLNEIYPEIDRDIAERWAKLSGAPESFAVKKLNFREKYPDLEKVWAQMLIDTDSEDVFFKYKLNETYPEIKKEASRFEQINKLVSSNY